MRRDRLDNRGALDREYDATRRDEARRRREDDRFRDPILGRLLRQDAEARAAREQDEETEAAPA